jgi:hypothetical protein
MNAFPSNPLFRVLCVVVLINQLQKSFPAGQLN